jgi:hypothetical protein
MSADTTSSRGNIERLFARGFTVLGGVFWIVAAFAGPRVYGGQSVLGAFGVAIYPLIFTGAVLVIGWFHERLVSMMLAAGAMGTIGWGVIMGWESTVWAIMLMFFIAPTVIAALLYYLAGSEESIAEAESRSSNHVLS